MKDQKNIERLFQEKFKDFEATPPLGSWDAISSRLNEKKKKKRVVPFWFQLSGIAASLVIIGALIWNFQSEENAIYNTNDETIVGVDNETNSRSENSETKLKNNVILISDENNQNTTVEKQTSASEKNQTN